MDPNLERRLTEVESRSRGNAKRLGRLEETVEVINRLAMSVERLATKQENMAQSVTRLDGKVTALEARPAHRWENVVDRVITAAAAGLIGFILAQMGIA